MTDDLHNLIGRTRLARSPVASPSSTTTAPSPPSSGASAMPVEDPILGSEPPDRGGATPHATSEELALIAVLRLIDRSDGLQPLSPVERAFVEGARVTFDRLAKLCKSMLDRKPSDFLAALADPRQEPTSTIGSNIELAAGPRPASKAPHGPSKPANASEA